MAGYDWTLEQHLMHQLAPVFDAYRQEYPVVDLSTPLIDHLRLVLHWFKKKGIVIPRDSYVKFVKAVYAQKLKQMGF